MEGERTPVQLTSTPGSTPLAVMSRAETERPHNFVDQRMLGEKLIKLVGKDHLEAPIPVQDKHLVHQNMTSQVKLTSARANCGDYASGIEEEVTSQVKLKKSQREGAKKIQMKMKMNVRRFPRQEVKLR